jgi:hypothetical protein
MLALACDARETSKPVPVAAPASTKSSAPESEPELGRACTADRDCGPAAPRCLGFGEDEYVETHAGRAVVMHCSRPCDDVECAPGYGCRRAPVITGVVDGRIEGNVSYWCGKQVTITPTPIEDIPRWAAARYFTDSYGIIPIVSLHWEGAELVVVGPGSLQRFSSAKAAREAFMKQAEAIQQWTELWPASTPNGPNVPGAIAPSFRKTLYNVPESTGVAAMSKPERLAREGAVLVWALRGNRGMVLFGETAAVQLDTKKGLDAFFAMPTPRR